MVQQSLYCNGAFFIFFLAAPRFDDHDSNDDVHVSRSNIVNQSGACIVQWKTVRVVGINQIKFLGLLLEPCDWKILCHAYFGVIVSLSLSFSGPRVTRGAVVLCRWHDSLQLGKKIECC